MTILILTCLLFVLFLISFHRGGKIARKSCFGYCFYSSQQQFDIRGAIFFSIHFLSLISPSFDCIATTEPAITCPTTPSTTSTSTSTSTTTTTTTTTTTCAPRVPLCRPGWSLWYGFCYKVRGKIIM